MLPLVVLSPQAQAASIAPLEDTVLSSNTEYCSYDSAVKSEKTYQAFTMLPYREQKSYLANSIVIAEAKTDRAASLSPSKTVLTKVESTEADQIIEVTPVPQASLARSVEYALVTPSAGQSGSVLNAELLFQMVNSHRNSIGLSSFAKDPRVCEVVNSRAPELDNEIYGSSYMHAGFQARSLPYWATENMISMQTEEQALSWWLNSPVHRSAIEGDYAYACLACSGKSCAMVFTNFEPKSQQVAVSVSPVVEPLNK
jgi:uncharacterized protein YkwD